ncbi:MAG TPA: type II and III secretion system protein family protein [Beijerinckiaceae bacterium]|jgi:pilus assembly protein CpaC
MTASSLRSGAATLALLAASALLTGGALAQDLGAAGKSSGLVAPAPVVSVGAHEQAVARRMEISIGRSVIVDLPRDAKEIFVANPKVANAVVRSTRKLFVIGMENGATSIFVMDADGKQIAALEVNVGRDLNVLKQTLRATLPHANIEIKPAGDSVLMTGTVNSAGEAQQAADIANAFVGQTNVKGAVINGLTIKGRDQVMLRVTVAEVGRAVLKQFGVETHANFGNFRFNSAPPFPLNVSPFPESVYKEQINPVTGQVIDRILNNTVNGFGKGSLPNVDATLRAFERAGVSRVLAQPTLTAISGESASFKAGGEVPVPRSSDCSIVGRACTVGVEFKPYGVSLNFTPVVVSENRISLRVNTEVSEIDPESRVTLSGISVFGFKVRRTETTVELASGATIMSAGLLQQSSNAAVNGIPGLLNLPVLGTLFRSREYQRKETELMILVTPYIAKAMEAKEVARPDDGFVEASDAQTVLLGRLNRLYGVAGAPPPGAALKGRFGFIND